MADLVSQKIRLGLSTKGVPPTVYIHQNDSLGRKLIFEIVSDTGVIELPTGSKAYIEGTKPDKTSYSYACEVTGNEIAISVPLQMAAVAGEHLAQMKIVTSTGEVAYCINMFVFVQKAAMDPDAAESETEIPGLVEQAQDAFERARDEADRAEAVAERMEGVVERAISATESATDAAESANNAAAVAEQTAEDIKTSYGVLFRVNSDASVTMVFGE